MKSSLIKIISYAGQIFIVIITLYLFFYVWQGHAIYDVEYSGDTDDARWRVDGTLSEYDVYELFFLAIYLFVSKLPLFLYFTKLANNKDKCTWWTLPEFDMGKSCRWLKVFSVILSMTFLSVVIWFDCIMPEVFTPTITYSEMKDLHYGYPRIDSFWAASYRSYWMIFILCSLIYMIAYTTIFIMKRLRTKHHRETI